MLGRKEEGSKRVQFGLSPCAGNAFSSASAATVTTTITTTTGGHVLTWSEYISQLDEAARRRLDAMNEKLRGLEMQMEALEVSMNRANDSTMWS